MKSANKLLTFRLFGSFAHFNQPLSNRFRNTYSTIPKPQLLGLIGSIAGLEGYKDNKTSPMFYNSLNDVKVYIKCNSNRDRRFSVTYNSLNSFLNNRVDSGSPNVIMNEQILLHPDYEIGLVLDDSDELHKKIINNIQNNCSFFHIYLGKNEFFANIEYISLNDYKIENKKKVVCNTIIPFDLIDEESVYNMKLEMLPIGFAAHFKYKYQLMAIPQEECEISLKNQTSFASLKGKHVYVF